MTISTKFNVGDTVYKKFNKGYRAYIVTDIDIHIFEENRLNILYKLTRNLKAQAPSGGELSKVLEQNLSKDPE